MKPLVFCLAALGMVGSTMSWSAPANAQQACVAHADATERLESKFNEKVVGRGLANAGKKMLELFVSEKGSWTLVVSDPTGRSCIIANGENWQDLPQLLGQPA